MVQACNIQIHVSRSLDPFLNLSVENYLLRSSPPKSTILFLYVNRPCVVIGRNQNPWLEVDLSLLKRPRTGDFSRDDGDQLVRMPQENVELVRRRSGGGAVFHDKGNVNYCVICPTANFTRDKHAEMVTSAIRELNLRARVNERHDIVLDQGEVLEETDWPDTNDMHRTIFHPDSKHNSPLKVSGSAYKMIRQRCLHHGTCLLDSPNLPMISRYLRSPSQPFLKARGVESVRSSISNIKFKTRSKSHSKFKLDVIRAFQKLYNVKIFGITHLVRFSHNEVYVHADGEWVTSGIGDECNSIDEVREGIKELQVSVPNQDHIRGSAHMIWIQSDNWLYGQTPQFTISSHSNEEDERPRPALPKDFPPSVRTQLPVTICFPVADTGDLVPNIPAT